MSYGPPQVSYEFKAKTKNTYVLGKINFKRQLVPGFVPRDKFPGLLQEFSGTRIDFLKDSKIHINPSTPKISMVILLTVCHTFNIGLTDF